MKLVIEEPESAALKAVLDGAPRRVSSEIAVVELARAVTRHDPTGRLRLELRAFDVLQAVSLYSITRRLLLAAARLDPPLLRSLDALHLATALELRGIVDAVVAYDERLVMAAQLYGLTVLAPQ